MTPATATDPADMPLLTADEALVRLHTPMFVVMGHKGESVMKLVEATYGLDTGRVRFLD